MRKENREAVNDRFLQELDKHKIIADVYKRQAEQIDVDEQGEIVGLF